MTNPQTLASGGTAEQIRQKRILICEPHSHVAPILKNLLSGAGYDVVLASGTGVSDEIRSQRAGYDLLLVACGSQNQGLRVIANVRNLDEGVQPKQIALMSTDPSASREATRLGVPFVSKDDLPTFSKRVAELIRLGTVVLR